MATAPTKTDEEQKLSNIFNNFPQIQENFHKFSRIGEGTFSTVYQGLYRKENNFSLAFKVLVPTSGPDRVEKEIQMLRVINGEQNVITLLTCMRHDDIYILVMPHFPHHKFQTFFHTFTPHQTQKYMRSLLESITHVHRYNIIHRDIKPSNFLYNSISGHCKLVDFGLAQYLGLSSDAPEDVKISCALLNRFKETTTVNSKKLGNFIGCEKRHATNGICNVCLGRPSQQVSRAGTPGFRAPEVLMKYSPHTVEIDIWATGIILFSILTGRYPFFKSQDDLTALGHIATIFGTDAVQTAAKAMHKEITCQPYIKGFDLTSLCRGLRGVVARNERPIESIKSPRTKSETELSNTGQHEITPRRSNRLKNKEICNLDVSVNEDTETKPADQYPAAIYDLLKLMLALNPQARLSALDALKHPFFAVDFSVAVAKQNFEE